MARLKEIHACPDFFRGVGCGCAFGRCRRTDRPTSYDECDACLTATGKSGWPECQTVAPPIGDTVFVPTAKLVRDALALAAILPPSIDAVIGIARSGLMAAAPVAVHLHLPLYSVSIETGVVDLHYGHRMRSEQRATPGHLLLLDDTIGLGAAMSSCSAICREHFPGAQLTRAAVYVTPGMTPVEYAYALYPGQHVTEWCFVNGGFGNGAMVDFDGILCEDCTPEDDDDGPRYRRFLAEAKPLYLPRRYSLVSVATARHEKYREQTMKWLARNRAKVDKLIMRDWEYYPHVSHDEQVAAWKAEVFRASGLPYFVESSAAQAETIHQLTSRTVICPAAERVWPWKP